MGLNENTNEKAYVLGRIFAVLEAFRRRQIRESIRLLRIDIIIRPVRHQLQFFQY